VKNLSDQIDFRGVNPKSGSPYTPEELQARKKKQQEKHNRWLEQLHQSEDIGQCVKGMNLCKTQEDQAKATIQAGWNLNALVPLVEELKTKESQHQEEEAKKNRLEAEEKLKIYDKPENNTARAWVNDRTSLRKMTTETLFTAVNTFEKRHVSLPPLSDSDYVNLENYLRTILLERQINTQKDNPSLAQKIAQYLHLV
jgi:hypothetical protein